MNAERKINSVALRLLRNRRVLLLLIAVITISLATALAVALSYVEIKLALAAAVLFCGLVLIAVLYWLKKQPELRLVACALLDDKFNTKERLQSFSELSQQGASLEELDRARQLLLEKQILEKIPDFDPVILVPLKFDKKIKYLIYFLPLIWGLTLYGLLPYFNRDPATNNAAAKIIQVLLEKQKELPAPLKEKLNQLMESLEQGSDTETVQSAIAKAEAELEKSQQELTEEARLAEQTTEVLTAAMPTPTVDEIAQVTPTPEVKTEAEAPQEQQQRGNQDQKNNQQQPDSQKDQQKQNSEQQQSQAQQQTGQQPKDQQQNSGEGQQQQQNNKNQQQSGEKTESQSKQSSDNSKAGEQEQESADSGAQKPDSGSQQKQQDAKQQALDQTKAALDQVKQQMENQQQAPGESGSDNKAQGNEAESQQPKQGSSGDPKQPGKSDQQPDDKTNPEQQNQTQELPQKMPTEAAGKPEQSEPSKNQKPGSSDSQKVVSDQAQTEKKLLDQGESGPGIEGEKKYNPAEIKSENEKFDPTYTGGGDNRALNKQEAVPKTSIAEVELAKPETIKGGESQELPLEYRDLLR